MDEYIVTDNLITYINSKGEEHCPYCKYQDTCHGIACYGGEPIEPPCCYQEPDNYLDFDIIKEEMEESNGTVKEVKRPAKVGEYIKIVNIYPIETDYENGDIFKVDDCYPDGDVCVKDDTRLVLYGEYVVLEGYNEQSDIIDTPYNLEIVVPINNPSTYDLQKKIYNKLMKGNENMNKVLKLYYDRKCEEIEEKYIDKVNNDFDNIDVVKQYKTLIENFEKEQEALFKTVENFDNDYLVPSYDSNLYKYSISELKTRSSLMATYEDDKANEIEKLKELVEEVDAQLSLSEDLNYQMEVLTRYDILDKKTNKVKA